MGDNNDISMTYIKSDKNGTTANAEDGLPVKGSEKSLLLLNEKTKSNPLSTSASYRTLLSSSEHDKEYPSTEEMDRSLYIDNTTSRLASLMHIIKGNLGIGALGLPFAMMNAGIVVGPVLLLGIAIVVIYCMNILVQSNHAFCTRTRSINLGYAQVAEMSVGLYYPKAKHLGGLIVNIFLVITQLGFCCVYFIFVSDTFQQVFSDQIQLNVRIWVAIILLPVILLSYIRTLKILFVISMVSNIFYSVGVVCILVYAGQTMKSPETLPKFVGFPTVPLAFGAIVFTLEGIGVILPVENVMAIPRKFICVLNIGMAVVVLIYLLLSVLGFLSCGMHCLGSFTLNLPNTPYYTAVKGTFAISIFLTYFIQFYVPITIIVPLIQQKVDEKYRTLVDYGTRTLLVCLTAALAVGIPELGDMISLVGSVGCTALAIIFPAVIHILTFSYDNSLTKTSLVVDVIVIIFGVLGTVFGMYSSIVDIVWNLQHPGVPRGASLINSTRTNL